MNHYREPVKSFAARLAALTNSTKGYRNGWGGCIRMLREVFGMNDREIEAVIRSKWTRWAGDSSQHRHGEYTSTDLKNYIYNHAGAVRNIKAELKQLVLETFGPEVPTHKFKKYILFVWGSHEGAGGLNNIEDSFDTLEDAVKGMKQYHSCGDNFQIVDRDTWEVVGNYY